MGMPDLIPYFHALVLLLSIPNFGLSLHLPLDANTEFLLQFNQTGSYSNGQNVDELSSHQKQATVHGGIEIIEGINGIPGMSLQQSQYLTFTPSSWLSPCLLSTATYEVWAESDLSSGYMGVMQSHFGFPWFKDTEHFGGVLVYKRYGSSEVTREEVSVNLQDGTVHYYVMATNMVTLWVYVDGVQITQASVNTPVMCNSLSYPFYIGNHTNIISSGPHYAGIVYSFKISNIVKTPTQIQAAFQSGVNSMISSTISPTTTSEPDPTTTPETQVVTSTISMETTTQTTTEPAQTTSPEIITSTAFPISTEIQTSTTNGAVVTNVASVKAITTMSDVLSVSVDFTQGDNVGTSSVDHAKTSLVPRPSSTAAPRPTGVPGCESRKCLEPADLDLIDPDSRPSARMIGLVAIIMMAIQGGLLFLVDIPTFRHDLIKLHENLSSFWHHNRNTFCHKRCDTSTRSRPVRLKISPLNS